MMAVPTVLMILLRYVVANSLLLNRVAPEYIGVFPFVIMFIVAAITTQRERARGTLERLMAMPLGKLDPLAGYGIAFGLVACVQVTLVLVVSLTWLGVTLPGSALPTLRSSWRSPSPPWWAARSRCVAARREKRSRRSGRTPFTLIHRMIFLTCY